jgi:hypothetical protein
VVREAESLRRHMRGEERLRGVRRLFSLLRQWLNRQRAYLSRFLGQKREDILLAEFEQTYKQNRNPYARLRDYIESASPRPEVMDHLPFYYKQLFSANPSLGSKSLANREREMALARSAVERMQEKIGGAILVLGEAFSGKTYFCESIAHHFFDKPIYRITPPAGGSTRVLDLTREFQQSLQAKGSLNQLVERAEAGSVFLLNDLELWWRRSQDGYQVLRRIHQLVDRYSTEYYFIMNCNTYAMQFLQRSSDIGSCFISTIQLSPFSADQLRDIVLTRHYSGGLEFELDDTPEKELKPSQLVHLFRRYRNISGGNVGVALHLWLSNIRTFRNEVISIQEPRDLSMAEIEKKDWLVLLSQFVLHKHLTLDQLKAIYRPLPQEKIESWLQDLLRAGLLIHFNKDILEINPYAYKEIIKQLKRRSLIT